MINKGLPHTNSLTVVVPIYNEVNALPEFLPGLKLLCEKCGWKAILVDDGSDDGSTEFLSTYAHYPFIKVIYHKVNRGYGWALKSGIHNCETSHVVTIDGDGQHFLTDIQLIYDFALEKDADLVVGNRGKNKNANPYREMGKWLIRNFSRFLMPLPIHDLNSGFKLYRTDLAQRYLHLCPNSMAFSDIITLTFISQHNLVLEHPINIQNRKTGKSTIGVQTAFETVIEILNLAMLFNPLKIFLPISIFCFVIGFSWGLPIILLGRGVSVGAMLAIVLGAISFMLGLVTHQLAAIRMEKLDISDPD